jgi:hypothetical protein
MNQTAAFAPSEFQFMAIDRKSQAFTARPAQHGQISLRLLESHTPPPPRLNPHSEKKPLRHRRNCAPHRLNPRLFAADLYGKERVS